MKQGRYTEREEDEADDHDSNEVLDDVEDPLPRE